MILALATAIAGVRVVDGPRTADDLTSGLGEIDDQARICTGTGSASVGFEITPDGTVTVSRVSGEGRACLRRLFGSLRFDAAEGPTSVIADIPATSGLGSGAGLSPPPRQNPVQPVPVGLPVDTGLDPFDPTGAERPTVTGALLGSEVRDTLRRSGGPIRHCYDRERANDPSLGEGRIVIRWVIDDQGQVISAYSETSTLHHFGVEGCVLDTIRGLRFPAHGTGQTTIVSYPLVFRP